LFPEDALDGMIKACDKNENGVIEIDEFIDWMWSSSITESERSDLVQKSGR
jgi:Ca2+-binding EF-hand superfamily protein